MQTRVFSREGHPKISTRNICPAIVAPAMKQAAERKWNLPPFGGISKKTVWKTSIKLYVNLWHATWESMTGFMTCEIFKLYSSMKKIQHSFLKDDQWKQPHLPLNTEQGRNCFCPSSTEGIKHHVAVANSFICQPNRQGYHLRPEIVEAAIQCKTIKALWAGSSPWGWIWGLTKYTEEFFFR